MKKFYSLLLVLCLIFLLSACGGNETATDNDTGSFCTECGEDISATDKFCGSCGAPVKKPTTDNSTTNATQNNDSGDLDSTDIPSSTTNTSTTTKPEISKPTATTKPNTPSHTHSYSGATCTAPAKCSCGATSGSALGHSYNNATCTEPKKCSRCGATSGSALGHSYSNGICTRCGGKDSSYVKTYSVGETWVVDGQWEFTVHSAEKHYMCNKYSDHNDMAQCVIITYSYKNLGYTGTYQDLYINSLSFDVYDAEGEAAETYPCTHAKSAKVCSVGTKCSNAQEAYALYNNSSQTTLIFEHYTSNGLGEQKAIFVIPVS